MMELFSDQMRRDPYPLYDQLRSSSPLLSEPKSGLWMVFDYDGVKRVLSDHETFGSRIGPAEWLLFVDPPRQTKLRGLISKAFTPGSVASLEPRIRAITHELLDRILARDEIDFAAEFSFPLPMQVIAELLGVPIEDRSRYARWSDVILNMSYTVVGSSEGPAARASFDAVTLEMNEYLTLALAERRSRPKDDLLTRLLHAELDGEHLTQTEILGFFQLLLLAGQETTTNLMNNAMLCFMEHPEQLARLRASPELLPLATEEVLRYRSPLHWMLRYTKKEAQLDGHTIPAGKVVLPMMGSANRDPKQFTDPNRFDITRNPNPHLAFGHGIHFCLGAALARLEAKVALTEVLKKLKHFELASKEPWEPRKALHVHGPNRLPIRFEAANN